MGTDQEKIQMNEFVDEVFIVSLFAHLRIPLKEAGVNVADGAILFIPDKDKKESAVRAFELYGGVRGEIHGNKIPAFPNYKVGLVAYQPFYKEEAIRNYISCDKYFPVMLVCGIVPEKLLFCHNIITLEKVDNDFEKAKKRAVLFRKVTNYLHDNGQITINFFQKYIEKWEKINVENEFYRALYFSSLAYSFWLANNMEEQDSWKKIQEHMEVISQKMLFTLDFGNDGASILLMVKRAILKYVDENSGVLIGNTEKVEGDLMTCMNNGMAILYDDSFYYIGDPMFRKIIEAYQQVISYLSVKQELHQAGILCCDDVEGNYTTKMTITNVYGIVERVRFLKLRRERIDDEGELTLAERRYKNVCREI